MAEMLTQQAPYPDELADLIAGLRYWPGWHFELCSYLDRGQGSRGTTLVITVKVPDTYHRENTIRVAHYMLVPPAAYDRRSWRRWLFDQIGLVEQHERCEAFEIDGVRPYAPSHGPGNDPYLVREIGTDEDQRTSFRGVLKGADDATG